jgi:YesN/AraC family two-component response regulator
VESETAHSHTISFTLSTSHLARALHCNADYLGRVFRRTFHLTLTEAIHRQRVRAAEKLLLNDSASLTEVAARCGFNDVGYFRQIFTKHTGLTPPSGNGGIVRNILILGDYCP